jgi:CRISPR system Cascade subunit CasA
MNQQFNLLEKPWISCIRLDGTPTVLSLRDTLLQAHTLREIQGESPLVVASLHRLLLAVLHRVYGPETSRVWHRLWETGCWPETPLDSYFQEWRHRFNLFDTHHPFYQIPDVPGKAKSLNIMALEWASGNNATLFDHSLDSQPPEIDAPLAARLLITLQSFHLAGLAGPGYPNFTDTPWARGVVFFVQGDNLFETLALNLVRFQPNSEHPIPNQTGDKPFWEQDDPFQPKRNLPLGYLDYLTFPSRRIRLEPLEQNGKLVLNQLWLAQGLSLSSDLSEQNFDPAKVYWKTEKKGWAFLRFNENRALWRDSDTILHLTGEKTRTAKVFHWLDSLLERGFLDRRKTYRFMALGMASESGQFKVYFFQNEVMPLPLDLLTHEKHEVFLEFIRESLNLANNVGRQLYFATKELAMWLVSPEDKNKAHADDYRPLITRLNPERRYWARLDVPFRQFIQDLPVNPQAAQVEWQQTVINTARTAFEQATAGIDDPVRGLKAVVLARRSLEWGLSQLNQKQTEEDQTEPED